MFEVLQADFNKLKALNVEFCIRVANPNSGTFCRIVFFSSNLEVDPKCAAFFFLINIYIYVAVILSCRIRTYFFQRLDYHVSEGSDSDMIWFFLSKGWIRIRIRQTASLKCQVLPKDPDLSIFFLMRMQNSPGICNISVALNIIMRLYCRIRTYFVRGRVQIRFF